MTIPLVAMMIAVMAALMVFSGLMLTGARLVRWLRLPTDLPVDCRFQPRPPAHHGAADAPARAAQWRERRAVCDLARETWDLAVSCQELATTVVAIHQAHPDSTGDSSEQTARDRAQRAETAAEAAAEAMHGDDLAAAQAACEEAKAVVSAEHSALQAQLATLPELPTSRRSLYMLLALAGIVLAWVLIGLPLVLQHLSS